MEHFGAPHATARFLLDLGGGRQYAGVAVTTGSVASRDRGENSIVDFCDTLFVASNMIGSQRLY